MMFWILVAFLTAAVAAFLLLPLLKNAARAENTRNDAEVYRDQLQELDRDLKSGLIGAEEAQLARAEIGRRLLAAAETPEPAGHAGAGRRNRFAQALVIIGLPAIGLCLYLIGGNPDAPDRPLADRLANPGEDINILISRAEQHLERNPNDGAGWDLLAPIYYRNGRMEQASEAFARAVALAGPSPERLSGLAESQIALAGGSITPLAQDALRQLLALSPGDPRATFYLALALKQEGKADAARDAFTALVSASPKDAPWLPLVNQHLAELGPAAGSGTAGATLGNPTQDDIAAAETLDADDRQEMIRGMVDSLSAKLQENPDNFDGWMRLIRSHAVLNEPEKARAALKDGLKTFPTDGAQGRQMLELARQLGLPTEGETQ